jgi:hypothetical protein
MTDVVNGGRRVNAGVMTSQSSETPPRGMKAVATTIRAMHVTVTARRDRDITLPV